MSFRIGEPPRFPLQESREGGHDGAETPNEPLAKVGKPQELLQVPDGIRDWSGGDSVHFQCFHPHPLWSNDIAQKGDGGLVEGALLRLDVELVLE